MTLVTVGAVCEADGHPSQCEEPVIGEVVQTSSNNISNTTASGETAQIATVDTADIVFDSHSHNYSSLLGCHDNQSHTLDPESSTLPNITVNGSQMYVVNNPVATDPGSGGDVTITDPGSINNMVQQ